ncbi:MAG: MOSC domain-containing protein [Magnetovibrio sp.]|nr:MOSC domain-containing protein [Magnetovibrio sp.]
MHIDQILRYPVKSLSVETLNHCTLSPGQGLPFDRKWALARPGSEASTSNNWHPKSNFLVLANEKNMAMVKSHFDEITNRLTFEAPGDLHGEGKMDTDEGRNAIAGGIAKHLGLDDTGTPILKEAQDIGYFDTTDGPVSLLNMESVRAVEKLLSKKLDPLRFRMNLIMEGVEAWAETSWIGKQIKIGDAVLETTKETGRCITTHINPTTGEIDIKVMHALKDHFGHTNMGVYAKVIKGGTISAGDAITISG